MKRKWCWQIYRKHHAASNELARPVNLGKRAQRRQDRARRVALSKCREEAADAQQSCVTDVEAEYKEQQKATDAAKAKYQQQLLLWRKRNTFVAARRKCRRGRVIAKRKCSSYLPPKGAPYKIRRRARRSARKCAKHMDKGKCQLRERARQGYVAAKLAYRCAYAKNAKVKAKSCKRKDGYVARAKLEKGVRKLKAKRRKHRFFCRHWRSRAMKHCSDAASAELLRRCLLKYQRTRCGAAEWYKLQVRAAKAEISCRYRFRKHKTHRRHFCRRHHRLQQRVKRQRRCINLRSQRAKLRAECLGRRVVGDKRKACLARNTPLIDKLSAKLTRTCPTTLVNQCTRAHKSARKRLTLAAKRCVQRFPDLASSQYQGCAAAVATKKVRAARARTPLALAHGCVARVLSVPHFCAVCACTGRGVPASQGGVQGVPLGPARGQALRVLHVCARARQARQGQRQADVPHQP